jgi:hypothetical protein
MLRTHDLGSLLDDNPDIALVSISDDQRLPFPFANWLATVITDCRAIYTVFVNCPKTISCS